MSSSISAMHTTLAASNGKKARHLLIGLCKTVDSCFALQIQTCGFFQWLHEFSTNLQLFNAMNAGSMETALEVLLRISCMNHYPMHSFQMAMM